MSNHKTLALIFALAIIKVTQSQVIVDSELGNSLNDGNLRVIEPIVLVHGGAGDIPDSRDAGKHKGTRLAVRLGYLKLQSGGSALDAVEAAVRSMELDDYFNAGYGAVVNLDGIVSMDASIMVGSSLEAGCVTLIEDILHPISLARKVMEKSNHTFLGGEGAMKFAKQQGIEILHPKGQLVTQYAKESLEEYKEDLRLGKTNAKTEVGDRLERIAKTYGEVGTVGAVAIDRDGNIAAATSTGGMTGKLPGRIGDSPILGSGTYADNFVGGVSVTGHGETILRFNVAQKILERIDHLHEDAATATKAVLEEMTSRLSETAGAITIDAKGGIGFYWTSEKMAWAYQRAGQIHYGIRKGDNFVEGV